jgi:hypothetical protein
LVHRTGDTLIGGTSTADTTRMGLDLSLGNLFVGIIISMIGTVVLVYGRKEARYLHMAAGAILLIFPYFVGIWWLAILIAAIILASLSVLSKLGY